MQREEGSSYQKYGVLLISISVLFLLPKMWPPFSLVLFHKTLLDSIGKKWGPTALHSQTVIIILQGEVRCGLSPEPDCSCCWIQLQWLHWLLPLRFALAASRGNALELQVPQLVLVSKQAFSCSFCSCSSTCYKHSHATHTTSCLNL